MLNCNWNKNMLKHSRKIINQRVRTGEGESSCPAVNGGSKSKPVDWFLFCENMACPTEKDNGFIVLHRKILKWEWYQKSEMVHLFLHLLLSANHEDSRWQGIEIKRGQLLTGLNSLRKNTHISQRKLRTCITRLKATNEIATKTTNKSDCLVDS